MKNFLHRQKVHLMMRESFFEILYSAIPNLYSVLIKLFEQNTFDVYGMTRARMSELYSTILLMTILPILRPLVLRLLSKHLIVNIEICYAVDL